MASAIAYTWTVSPNDSATFMIWPSPGMPMNSSAVNARIRETADEILRPVAM